jgi:phospholipid/cholesterol/gamma-HCH transport system substrate-binding protein
MERNANYALVGVVFVTLLFGAFVFVVWLANFQFNQQYDNYRIYFHGPVSGLSEGGTVQFNGIKMGEITHIELDERDANRVQTDIRVQAGTPIRTDSTAQAVSQGITGVKFVQISPGTPSKPLLREASRDRRPVIPAARGRMEDMLDNVGKVADGGAEALERVNRLLSDANIATMSTALADVQSVTGELSANRAMFARMNSAFGKVDRAAGDLQLTLASARRSLGSDSGAFAELSRTATELHGAATDMRGLIAELHGPVSELSSSTLPEATAALVAIQRAADRLDSVASAIEENPGAVLTSAPAKEVEIPQ